MIIKNCDKEWHSDIDELVDSTTDSSLTEDECERKRYLRELVEDGYYDPFRIDQADVAELMKLKIVVSEEDTHTHNFTDEDEKRLADLLEDDWDNLDDYSRVVYHIIMNTSSLPRWRRSYPPTEEYMRSLKDFLSIDPSSAKFNTWTV